MSGRPKTLAILGILVLFSTSACVAHPSELRTLDQILAVGFDSRAKKICTKTGSPTLPLQGKERTVAAVNSTVSEARTLVNSGSEELFRTGIGKFDDKTYVALCFFQGEKSLAPPNGRFLVAELLDDGDSAIIGRW